MTINSPSTQGRPFRLRHEGCRKAVTNSKSFIYSAPSLPSPIQSCFKAQYAWCTAQPRALMFERNPRLKKTDSSETLYSCLLCCRIYIIFLDSHLSVTIVFTLYSPFSRFLVTFPDNHKHKTPTFLTFYSVLPNNQQPNAKWTRKPSASAWVSSP